MNKTKPSITEIESFLKRSNEAGYANPAVQSVDEEDGSHTIQHQEGDWKFHDNYFGGEPYAGREVVFYKDSPVFVMVYYGHIMDTKRTINDVYAFLKQALLLGNSHIIPVRGPMRFEKAGGMRYEFQVHGTLASFHGTEKIFDRETCIYEAFVSGGVVDVR